MNSLSSEDPFPLSDSLAQPKGKVSTHNNKHKNKSKEQATPSTSPSKDINVNSNSSEGEGQDRGEYKKKEISKRSTKSKKKSKKNTKDEGSERKQSKESELETKKNESNSNSSDSDEFNTDEEDDDKKNDFSSYSNKNFLGSSTGGGDHYETFGSYQREELSNSQQYNNNSISNSTNNTNINSISSRNNNNNNNNNHNNNVSQLTESERVSAWLLSNNFDASVCLALRSFSIEDLLKLSKEDAKELLGVKNGIRLHLRVKQEKKNMIKIIKQQRGRGQANYKLFINNHNDDSSISNNIPSRDRHIFGKCGENYCKHGADALCSTPNCHRPLCAAHINKSLVSGCAYCASCMNNYSTIQAVSDQLSSVDVTVVQEQCSLM